MVGPGGRRIVSPGAMGSAVGAGYAADGHRVVATVAGRSERTAALAGPAGLELLPDLDAVVAESALVLSIVPPDRAGATAAAIAAAARHRCPSARLGLERDLAGDRQRGRAGPRGRRARARRRLDLRRPAASRLQDARLPLGTGAEALAAAAPAWIDARVVGARGRARFGGEDVHRVDVQGLDGAARARAADRARARRAPAGARRPARSFPTQIDRAARSIAVSTTKAERFVGEMREIAATQAGAGLSRRSSRRWPRSTPRSRGRSSPPRPGAIESAPLLEDVLDRLNARTSPFDRAIPERSDPSGVLPAQTSRCGREDLNLHEPKPTGT